MRPPRQPIPSETEAPLELTQEQHDELRKQLEQMHARLVGSISTRHHQEGEGGREVGDEMDEASFEGATAMTSRLLERDVQLLAEVDRALAKLADGTYGICEGTGEPIGFERLQSRPWARYSISYQEELERASRSRGGR